MELDETENFRSFENTRVDLLQVCEAVAIPVEILLEARGGSIPFVGL